MRKEQLFYVLGQIDDSFIKEAATEDVIKRKNLAIWLSGGAVAACLCIILFVAALHSVTFQLGGVPPMNPDNLNDQIIDGSMLENKNTVAESYVAPEPGTWFCFVSVNDALEKYAGQNVRYLLTFDLFSDQEKQITDADYKKECERLTKLGYDLFETQYWTYYGDGQKEYRQVIVGLFSEEQLKNFNGNENYGYAFHFVYNGDHTPLEFDSDKVISFHNSGIAE